MEISFQNSVRKTQPFAGHSFDQNLILDEIKEETSSLAQSCPRCESKLSTLSGHPYCSGCNWDSLTDLRLQVDKWAA